MEKKKAIKPKRYKHTPKHWKYLHINHLREVSIVTLSLILALGVSVFHTYQEPNPNVLGASTSSLCAFWNLTCIYQSLFNRLILQKITPIATHIPASTSNIDTSQLQQPSETNLEDANPTPTPPIPTSSPIAGYKYYFDTQYRYSIQYPRDSIPSEDMQPASNGQNLQPGLNGVVFQGSSTIIVRSAPNGLNTSGSTYSLIDFVNKSVIPSDHMAQSLHKQITLQQQTFGPNQVVVVSGLTDGTTAFILSPDGFTVYEIIAALLKNGDSTFSNMISSFRMPPLPTTTASTPASTANLETYTNSTFHFSIKYPKNDIPSAYLPSNNTGSWSQNSIANLMENTEVALPPYSQGTQEEQNSVNFIGNGGQVQLLLGRNNTGLSLQQYVQQYIVPHQPHINEDKINVYAQNFRSHQGVVAENLTDTRGTTVFFQTGTLVFSISSGVKKSLADLPTLSTVASSLTY